MRTTIDLPDSLYREVKAQAALSGLTLKDLISRFVEAGLRREMPYPPGGERSLPPVIREATTGRVIPALSREAIRRIEVAEDESRYG